MAREGARATHDDGKEGTGKGEAGQGGAAGAGKAGSAAAAASSGTRGSHYRKHDQFDDFMLMCDCELVTCNYNCFCCDSALRSTELCCAQTCGELMYGCYSFSEDAKIRNIRRVEKMSRKKQEEDGVTDDADEARWAVVPSYTHYAQPSRY